MSHIPSVNFVKKYIETNVTSIIHSLGIAFSLRLETYEMGHYESHPTLYVTLTHEHLTFTGEIKY